MKSLLATLILTMSTILLTGCGEEKDTPVVLTPPAQTHSQLNLDNAPAPQPLTEAYFQEIQEWVMADLNGMLEGYVVDTNVTHELYNDRLVNTPESSKYFDKNIAGYVPLVFTVTLEMSHKQVDEMVNNLSASKKAVNEFNTYRLETINKEKGNKMGLDGTLGLVDMIFDSHLFFRITVPLEPTDVKNQFGNHPRWNKQASVNWSVISDKSSPLVPQMKKQIESMEDKTRCSMRGYIRDRATLNSRAALQGRAC